MELETGRRPLREEEAGHVGDPAGATAATRAENRSEPTDAQVPRLIEGTELLGPFHGSGFRDDRYLVRRPDGQTILMSSLLYLVTTQIDGRRNLELWPRP